jgi:ArsR family transcriptional regulator
MKNLKVKKIVKDKYKEIATTGCGCGCSNLGREEIATDIGYTKKELSVVGEANLGLGCGNPVALSKIKKGDVMLDLGSGAGIDCFLAAKKVGPNGRVVGLDMTREMVSLARKNAKMLGIKNVKFFVGDIEKLPFKKDEFDVIITNCVINLAPNKQKVFKEAHRVLKAGGKMYISDIVLLGELTSAQRKNKDLISGCVAGALLKKDYIGMIKNSGFAAKIINENKAISKKQYQGIKLESILIEARKI